MLISLYKICMNLVKSMFLSRIFIIRLITDPVIVPVLGAPDQPRHDLGGRSLVTLPLVSDHGLHVGADHVQETVTKITKQRLPHVESGIERPSEKKRLYM